jgi:hypothetical protein
MMDLTLKRDETKLNRYCEAKQSKATNQNWIASSLSFFSRRGAKLLALIGRLIF